LRNQSGRQIAFFIDFWSLFEKITNWLAESLSDDMLPRSFLWIPISVCATVTGWADSGVPEERVAIARQRVTPILIQRFAAAGLPYPVSSIFFRVHKMEREFELWARNDNDGSYRLVQVYPVLAASGELGPKRREGDRQVPEGFYQIDQLNPKSEFHLSLRINYPNASDQKKSDPAAPGFDIYVHGGERSAGCLAMGDDAIEEIYIAAQDSAAPVLISIFPGQMLDMGWPDREKSFPDYVDFWDSLKSGYRFFSEHRRLPPVTVDEHGNYLCD
jgi:murein L,D-transpeptidase YafK